MSKKRRSAQSVSDETNNLTLNIRRTALSLAVAAALPGAMAMPVSAYAQDADDEVIDEIVTYGSFRASLITRSTPNVLRRLSLRLFPLKTSASCLTRVLPRRYRACRVLPASAWTVARARSRFVVSAKTSVPRRSMVASRSRSATIAASNSIFTRRRSCRV